MGEYLATTFLIITFLLNTFSANRQTMLFALEVSATVAVSCLTIQSTTGAGLNPWRIFPSSILTGELFTQGYWYAWVYYIGQPLAGLVTGLVWRKCVIENECAKKDDEID